MKYVIALCAALSVTACNNQPLAQDVTGAFATVSACVISSIETGALSNPIQIAAQCGGLVIAQVIAIIENEIAREKSNVGASAKLQLLEAVLAKAKALP